MTLPHPVKQASQDPIDMKARVISQAGVDGVLTANQARWELACLIDNHPVFGEAAAAYLATTKSYRQEVDDLAERLRILIVLKLTGTTNGGYDLQRTASGESLIGWARNFSITAARSEHRNQNVWKKNQGSPYGRETADGANVWSAETLAAKGNLVGASRDPVQESGGIPGEADTMAQACVASEVAEVHVNRARGLRGISRLCEDARGLTEFYGLPSVQRPDNPADRERLREMVASDGHAAFRSVRALLEAMSAPHAAPGTSATWSDSHPHPNLNTSPDAALVSLWSGYRSTDLGQLTQTTPGVAHVLALAALSPRPAPLQKVVSALVTDIEGRSDEPGWRTLAQEAVHTWAQARAEMTSEFSFTHPAAPKSADTLRTDARRWRAVARAVAAFTGGPLGVSVHQVESALTSRADTIQTEMAMAKAGTRVGRPGRQHGLVTA